MFRGRGRFDEEVGDFRVDIEVASSKRPSRVMKVWIFGKILENFDKAGLLGRGVGGEFVVSKRLVLCFSQENVELCNRIDESFRVGEVHWEHALSCGLVDKWFEEGLGISFEALRMPDRVRKTSM